MEEEETIPDKPEKKNLTDWANEPSVETLKQDYTDAKSDTDEHITDIDNWLDNLHVKGKAKVKCGEGRSQVTPKVIRKQAEWRYASLGEPFLSTDDIFDVDPITWEDKEAAVQNALVLNNQFNTKIDKVRFIDELIRTLVDEGTAIVRVGWREEEKTEQIEVKDFDFRPSINPQVVQMHQDMHEQMQRDPILFEQVTPPELQQAHQMSMQSGQPIEPILIGSHMEEQTKTVKNHPTVEVCNYKNLTIDPTAKGNLNEAGFIIYSFASSHSELSKDGRYSNLDYIDVESNNILGDPDYDEPDDGSFNFTDKPRKKFMVQEYFGFWDKDGNGETSPILAAWVGDTMVRLEENPYPDGKNPYVGIQYLPVRRSNYGEPDGELLEDNQKIIGAVTRGMIDIMGRSANGQQGSRKDALDLTNKRKFDRGEDYEFNSQVDPKQAFHMHTFPEIPQSAGLMLQLQNADAESLTGVKAFHTGISGEALGTTATGVRSAMDATAKRELGILRRASQGLVEIGRKIIAMNAVFLSEEEVIRVTHDEFVVVRRDDLAGEFDLRISTSTAESDNQKAEELAFMLQTTASTMGPEFAQIILADIAKLRKMPALAQKIEEYKPPPPDPLEQQLKELEVAKLEAEVMKLQGEAQEKSAESNLDTTKIGTEEAKTRKLDAETDAINLDFVEQESGTKQERDLQLQSEQARGNAQMKIVEAAAKAKFKPKGEK
jgi:hypothetical protein